MRKIPGAPKLEERRRLSQALDRRMRAGDDETRHLMRVLQRRYHPNFAAPGRTREEHGCALVNRLTACVRVPSSAAESGHHMTKHIDLHLRQKLQGEVMSRFQNCCVPGLLLATLIAAGCAQSPIAPTTDASIAAGTTAAKPGGHSRWGSIK